MSAVPRPCRRPSRSAHDERIARPVLAVDRHHVGVPGQHEAGALGRPDRGEQIGLARRCRRRSASRRCPAGRGGRARNRSARGWSCDWWCRTRPAAPASRQRSDGWHASRGPHRWSASRRQARPDYRRAARAVMPGRSSQSRPRTMPGRMRWSGRARRAILSLGGAAVGARAMVAARGPSREHPAMIQNRRRPRGRSAGRPALLLVWRGPAAGLVAGRRRPTPRRQRRRPAGGVVQVSAHDPERCADRRHARHRARGQRRGDRRQRSDPDHRLPDPRGDRGRRRRRRAEPVAGRHRGLRPRERLRSAARPASRSTSRRWRSAIRPTLRRASRSWW